MRNPTTLLLLALLMAALAGGGALWLRSRYAEVAPAAGTGPDRETRREPSPSDAVERAPVEVAGPPVVAVVGGPARREIAGRVVTMEGGPVAAAEVVLSRLLASWPVEERAEIERVLSGEDGRFQFAVTTDDELVLDVSGPGFASARVFAPRDVRSVLVRLEPGFTVHGVVVGPDLCGVSDCFVALEPGPWSRRRALTTRTDADGRFRFTDVCAGETGVARITARYQDYQPATLSSFPIGSRELVRLQFYGQLSSPLVGRVMRAGSGEPVIGARVRLFSSTAWNGRLHAPYEATTDENGAYQLNSLSLGSAVLEVRHPELSTASRVVTLGRGATVQNFEMVRRSAVEIRLRGDVPPGLAVILASAANELGHGRADAEGVVRFDRSFTVGPADLEVVGGRRVFARSSGRTLSMVVEDAESTELELEVVPTSRLIGRVLAASGEPISGVTVATPRFRFNPRNVGRWYAQTDTEGRFELLGLPVGSAALRFEHPGFAVVEVEVETPLPGEQGTEQFQLPRAGTVRGRVSSGGEPLAGAGIFAGRGRNATVTTVTDAEGRYSLRVAPGTYRIYGRYSTMPVQVSDGLVRIDSGVTVDGVDLDFPLGRRLRGIVSGFLNLPVSDAFVFVAGEPDRVALSTADQNGRFELEVPEGPGELIAFSPNFRLQVREPYAAETTDLHVRLPWIASGILTGTLLGLPGSRPLGEAILRMEPLDERAEWDDNVRQQRTLRSVQLHLTSGRFTFDEAPAGRSRIEIAAPGFVPFVAEIDLTRAESLDLGVVRLEPGAELHGVVRDVEGRPVAGAIAHLGVEEDLRLSLARRTMADARGMFRLRGVCPDALHVVVVADGFAATSIDLRFPQDLLRSEPLEVVLQRASSLVVQLWQDGEPTSECHLLSLAFEGRLFGLRYVDGEGKLTVPIDRPGRYTVALFGSEDQASVDVTAGDQPQTYEVKLELR